MSLRVWVDVYNTSGVRQGDGPVESVRNVSITRMLDGPGTISFTVSGSDERAVNLLTNRKRVRIFTDNARGEVRELGRGIIYDRKFSESPGATTVTYTCADNLAELKDRNTFIGLKYAQKQLGVVIENLVAMMPGWSVTIDDAVSGNVIDARFDGVTILKALQQLVKTQGVHLRLAGGNTIEVGEFGDLCDTFLLNVNQSSPQIDQQFAIIENIQVAEDTEEIVNRIVPLGAGTDAGALKLKRSTRTEPYTIVRVDTLDERRYWYIQDDTAVAQYGLIERVVNFPDISPIENTQEAKIAAANLLYDAAVAYLRRMRVPNKRYRVQLMAVNKTLIPGDKINIRYKGAVQRGGGIVDYVDINDDFWIMRVSENISASGHSVNLEIASVDMDANSNAAVVVRTIEDVQIQKLKPITSVVAPAYVFNRTIEPGRNGLIRFPITNRTLELLRFYLSFQTVQSFRHTHTVATFDAADVTAPGALNWNRYFAIRDGGIYTIVINTDAGGPLTEADMITSNEVFFDASAYPIEIGIIIDGVDRTDVLGGPWGTTNESISVELDSELLTEWIEENLYSEHTIEFYCALGYGDVEAVIEVYQTMQSITQTN